MSEHAIAEGPAETVDLLGARRYCDHAIRKIRDIAQARAVIDASHRDQLEEIAAWYEQETHRLDGEVERLRVAMRPMISALVLADPLGKQSVELVAGRAGFRAGRERVVVDDAEQALAWLEENAPDLVRVKREPDLAAIKERLSLGERFPGVHMEKGEPTYFTEPIMGKPEPEQSHKLPEPL